MKEIHDRILHHLRINYPETAFVLRSTNKYGRLQDGYWFLGNENFLCISFWDAKDSYQELPKIYLEVDSIGDTRIVFSDSINNLKLISVAKAFNVSLQFIVELLEQNGFSISPNANATLTNAMYDLVAKHREKKGIEDKIPNAYTTFFTRIAPALKMEFKEDKIGGFIRKIWVRDYAKKDYLTAIDNFFITERITIDTFIELNNRRSWFPFVSNEDFNENLNRISKFTSVLLDAALEAAYYKETDSHIVLNRLILSNIGHFEYLDFDFAKRVIILYGENGIGKSTIMQAIALGLTGLKDTKFVNEGNERLLNLLKINKAEKGKIEYSDKGSIELYYNRKFKNVVDFSRVSEQVNSSGILETAFTRVSDDRSDYKNIKDYGINGEVKHGFISLVKSFSQKKAETDSKNGKSKELNSDYPTLFDAIPLIYQSPDDSFKHFNNWILDAIDPKNPISYKSIEPALIVALDIIREITEGVFDFTPMISTQSGLYVKTPDAPEGIPIWLISQGYTNVIGWVGDFVKRLFQVSQKGQDFKNTHAICLIDEIDTYLHPKWQRTILKTLADTFVNTHFIVTTHSPLVITSLPSELVTVYHIGRSLDKMIAFELKDFNPYGADATRFLELAMGVEERPKEVTEKLEEYFDKIDDKEFEDAEKYDKEVLSNLIDKNDSALVKGRAEIETRRMLQKS